MDDRESSGGASPPIVFAGGFYPFPFPVSHLAACYRRAGRQVHFVPWRLKNIRDARVYGKSVADLVDSVCRESGAGQVDLVGFSFGAVASLYAIKHLGLSGRIRNFVSVGAPFRGAHLALSALPTILFTRAGRQMMPGSRFLAELTEGPLPPGPRYFAVSGSFDLICPPSTASLKGARNLIRPFSHASVIVSCRPHFFICSLLR